MLAVLRHAVLASQQRAEPGFALSTLGWPRCGVRSR